MMQLNGLDKAVKIIQFQMATYSEHGIFLPQRSTIGIFQSHSRAQSWLCPAPNKKQN